MTRDPFPAAIKSELDNHIDELLKLWHRHCSSYRQAKGYSGSDSTCRDYRAPGHWDWQNGAADARADQITVRGVEEAMSRVPNQPQRWHTALAFEAMNLTQRYAVWSSPVLPKNRQEREVLVLEARNMLAIELRRAGVLG